MKLEFLTPVDKLRAYIYRNNCGRCRMCGKKLTPSEIKYYGNTCDRCEGIITKKLTNG